MWLQCDYLIPVVAFYSVGEVRVFKLRELVNGRVGNINSEWKCLTHFDWHISILSSDNQLYCHVMTHIS